MVHYIKRIHKDDNIVDLDILLRLFFVICRDRFQLIQDLYAANNFPKYSMFSIQVRHRPIRHETENVS